MKGNRELNTASSPVNAQDFAIRRLLGKINTAMPVRVVAVDVPDPKGPVGFVDVLPLVQQVDGEGNGVAPSTLYNVPFVRMQGGKNAVIVNPQAGDVGLAVFCQRDIAGVKTGRGASGPVNPGSYRSLDMADGVYIGGLLNAAPERYVWVDDAGVTIEGVAQITMHGMETVITAERGVTINADVLINGSLTWTGTAQGNGQAAKFSGGLTNNGGTVQSNGIVLDTHVHGGVQPGGGNTAGPQ